MMDHTLLHSLLIQTGETGSVVNVMRTDKRAQFLDGKRLTSWALDDPTDVDFPLAAEILGEINVGLLTRIAELEADVASLPTKTARITELEAALAAGLAEIERLETALAAAQGLPPAGDVSKLTLMRRLDQLGKWSAFKALLAQLPEIVQDAWTLAQAIRADDPLFVAHATAIKAYLELTDEQFVALLAP